MKIVKAFPPNIEEIRSRFKLHDRVVFTYGDTIYSPNGTDLAFELIQHEKTHTRQQGNDPEGWWKKYLESPEFRLSQEIEAYRVQWRAILRGNEKDKLGRLRKIAQDLAGEMYGNLLSYEEAMQKITEAK